MKKHVITIVAVILLLIGSIFLIVDGFVFKSTADFLSRAKSVSGTVVNLVEHISEDSDHNTSITYRPEVKFITEQGKAILFRSTTGSNPPSYKISQQVKVLYDPANPQDAQIDAFFDLWGLFVIFGFLGGILSAIGVVAIILSIR
jgi:hypothetical protein